jgi:peptide-methionine (S)-S-oxide reductase
METIVFGAGCFWGVEELLRQIDGVSATRAGYAGGSTANPSYEDVCAERTGHAEVVEVTFDPASISYERLLERFWSSYPPADSASPQYRSIVVCSTPEQYTATLRRKEQLERAGQPIPTEILASGPFYPAEEYHQQYYVKWRSGLKRRASAQ